MPDLPGAEVDVMLNPGSNYKWGALPETNPRGLESPNNKIKTIKSYSIHVRVFRDSPKENTLPETHSLHLKMDGWKTIRFPFGARPIFRGELLVSGRVTPIHGFANGLGRNNPR